MLKRIIIHWTAGTYKACETDKKAYHFLIQGNGIIVKGKYKPEDNIDCTDKKYAAHTAQGNTGSIGVAFCGMSNFKNAENPGKYPLAKSQMEKGFEFIAQLCEEYNIPITPETVLTHYEFDCNRGLEGRKIDIICLPYEPAILPKQVGNYIRTKVKWYAQRNKGT